MIICASTDEPSRHLGENLAIAQHSCCVGAYALEHEGRDNRIEIGEYQNIVYQCEEAHEVVVSSTPSFPNPIGRHGMATPTNTNLDALDTKFDGWQCNEDEPSAKSSCSRGVYERDEFVGAEDGLESGTPMLGDSLPRSLFGSLHTDQVGAMVTEIEAALLGFRFKRGWIAYAATVCGQNHGL